MATFQPLYFSGGKYSSATDRKMIAALIASETSGARVSGVIPAGIDSGSLKVTSAGANTISIAPGMCVVPDSTTVTSSTGLYLAGIDTSSQTRTFSTNSGGTLRTDTVWAIVDETSYGITKKTLGNTTGSASATNTAKLTTGTTAHGFKAGETVSISGVDEIFDGSYVITAVPSIYTFEYEKTSGDIVETNVVAEVRVGSEWAKVTNKEINASTNLVTLTLSTTTGDFNGTLASGDVATVKGVDAVIDGTYVLVSGSGSSVTFYLNKPATAVTAGTVVSASSVALARVPFSVKIDEGTAGTYSAKTKIKLATYTVAAGGGTSATVTDTRQFVSAMGGVHYYNSTATAPAATAGRFRYNTSTNALEFYTTSWNTMLTLGTTSTTAAAGDHAHTGVYASSTHNHTGVYSAVGHTHVAADVTGCDGAPTTYVNVNAPTSAGTTSGSAISVTATSFSNLSTNITTTISLTAASYCLVQWSANPTVGSSNTIYLSANATNAYGGGTVSSSTSLTSSSHGTAATDGTAFGPGDIASTDTTGVLIRGSRLVKLATGSSTITLQAYRASSGTSCSLTNPVLRVIPIRFV